MAYRFTRFRRDERPRSVQTPKGTLAVASWASGASPKAVSDPGITAGSNATKPADAEALNTRLLRMIAKSLAWLLRKLFRLR